MASSAGWQIPVAPVGVGSGLGYPHSLTCVLKAGWTRAGKRIGKKELSRIPSIPFW